MRNEPERQDEARGQWAALSEAYDTALLDLDGVVYAGGNAIAHAVDSLAVARAGGMHLAYVTNNALRTPDVGGRASDGAGDTRPGRTTSSPRRRRWPG